MKRFTLTITMLAVAAFLAGCTPPATNAPANNANTNANTAKPTAAAPTKEALLEMDKKANEAFLKADGKHFEGMLSDKFVSYGRAGRMTKAELVQMVGGMKCDVKTWSLEDPQMAMIDADTAVLSYKGNFDGTCVGPDGKSMKIPSPVRAASVWVRSGDKWMGVFHGENVIADPNAAPPADKKEEPKKDDKAATNSNTAEAKPAAPAGSPNTDALVKIHTSGWEAWKAKDAKKLEEMTTANVTVVDPMGHWHGTKAETIKEWTEMKCEGVTTVKVADGIATALSPAVEILTSKGTADGTCNGRKNTDLYQTAFYVKEGDTWKLAFMFDGLGM